MPNKPLPSCRYLGCPGRAVNRGYCSKHGPLPLPCRIKSCPAMGFRNGLCISHWRERQKQFDRERGTPAERGYDETWANLRLLYLAEHCLCEECEKHGIVRGATEVHHIQSIRQRPDLRLHPENLMALCKECHSKMSQRKS